MKFSHNILHTYSFILGIIKHNWKIRRLWVADPLKLNYYEKHKFFGIRPQITKNCEEKLKIGHYYFVGNLFTIPKLSWFFSSVIGY